MEYRLSEYSPTERKVDDLEGQCNVWYNGNCKGGFYTSLQLLLGRVVEVYHASDVIVGGKRREEGGKEAEVLNAASLCLGLQSFLPTNLGRVAEERVSPGRTLSQKNQ
ncbi:hypothetical protein TNCV_4591221 [Trichonephila clavipes]|nr:hypothetical protein TNCV_4591221 [Trichonephila clavipes]